MHLAWVHPWDLTPREAIELQRQAAGRVRYRDPPGGFALPPRLVAVDVGYDRRTDRCAAALIVWDVRRGAVIDTRCHVQPSTFPYVPGLLSIRELPPLLPLFEALPRRPRLVICDGQGMAHPRRIGLASHLGVVLGCPTVGWAKTRLIGSHDTPGDEAGSAAPLTDKDGEQIGWALRSRTGCRPTYVSPGHMVSVDSSLRVARGLIGRYRFCEPARSAHALTRRLLTGAS